MKIIAKGKNSDSNIRIELLEDEFSQQTSSGLVKSTGYYVYVYKENEESPFEDWQYFDLDHALSFCEKDYGVTLSINSL
jgi:hypothetical protein